MAREMQVLDGVGNVYKTRINHENQTQNASGVFLDVLKLKSKTQKTAGVTVNIEGNSA